MQREGLAVDVDADRLPAGEGAREQAFGDRILHVADDGALERAGAERGLEAPLDEAGLGGVADGQIEAARLEQLLHAIELDVDDAQELWASERDERHDVADTVEELGTEEGLELGAQRGVERLDAHILR